MSHETAVKLPRLMRKEELCQYLGVSRHWVQRQVAEKRLPGVVRLGENSVRFDAEEIARWIEGKKEPVVEA